MNKFISVNRRAQFLILLFLFAIFGAPYFHYLTGSNNLRNIIILFFIFFYGTFIFVNRSLIKFKTKNAYALKGAILLLFISFSFWDYTYNIYSYVGIIIAYLVYILDYDFLKKILLYIFVLCLPLAMYEFFSGKLLFVNKIILLGEENIFDENNLSGGIGLFRSKAIFYGPLDFGGFIVGVMLLNRLKKWVIIIGIIMAFFANSRLAIIVGLLLFIYQLSRSKEDFFKISSLALILVVFISQIGIVILTNEMLISLVRILSVIDLDSGSNSARLYYWTTALDYFLKYDFMNLLFGNNGSYVYAYRNSTESSWLSLLVDNGFIGFLFYFYFIFNKLFYYFYKKQFGLVLIIFILSFVLSIQTFHLGAVSNFMLWLIIFSLNSKKIIDN